MQAFATPRRKLFARRNYSKHQFSHVPSRFQLNVNFKQSPWICKYFQPMAINSSLSCIYEQIFRLLLKISVYERHQLRIQAIFIKLPTGKQYYLQLQNLLLHSTFIPAFQTIPNESFHQIKSSTKTKMGNFAKNDLEANSTQCSQAVTHPSTD